MNIGEILNNLWTSTGFANLVDIRQVIMIALACGLLYLGIVKKFEPLLLVGIAFGMLLTNLPISDLYHPDYWYNTTIAYGEILNHGGLIDIFYIGVKSGIFPSLIFIGVGAMTDFGPIIANLASMVMGAAAQFGIFCAFFFANHRRC